MKIRRRGFEPISIAFLDVITCGFRRNYFAAHDCEASATHPNRKRRTIRASARSRRCSAACLTCRRQGSELEGEL